MESVALIALPSDARSDDITLHLVQCGCGFFGLVIYEESRRGSLDSECWDLTGLLVPRWHFDQLLQSLKDCPEPTNSDCECEAHLELGAFQQPSGRVYATVGLPSSGSFPVRLASW
jgi:hypothetical protein